MQEGLYTAYDDFT